METLGGIIRRLREERGMTQASLAWRVGVKANRTTNYESDYREPDLKTLSAIADALEVSLDEFRVLPAYSDEPSMEEVARTFRLEAWMNMTDEQRQKALELTRMLRKAKPVEHYCSSKGGKRND